MCKKKNECDCENNSMGIGFILPFLASMFLSFGTSRPTTIINIYSDKNIEVKDDDK